MNTSIALSRDLPLAEAYESNRNLYLKCLDNVRTLIKSGGINPENFQKEISVQGVWHPRTVEDLLSFNDHLFQDLNKISYPNPTDSFPYVKSQAYLLQLLFKYYQPNSSDVFYDLGSGGGLACLLMHLTTGCKSIGVEIQEPICKAAELKAQDLNLSSKVSFQLADACNVDYQNGDIFYFSNPFQGETMKKVIDQLFQVSLTKDILIFNASWCSDQRRLPVLFEELLPGRIYKSKAIH